ncbi:MAG: steroid 5-alpha reductase family enzyme [Pseudohongiellaceae bacterium]|jgi:steroid 5-alpha reductase family enzyme
MKPVLGILVIVALSGALSVAGSQGSAIVIGLPLFFICACVGFILHWLVFLPSFALQTEHYFDLTGALSYICTVILALSLHPSMSTQGIIICLMVALWAARLGSFLFLRVKKAGKDRRFNELKTRFWRYLFTWTVGGAWVFVTMAAALAAATSMQQVEIGALFFLGGALWIIGFAIEIIADRQKTQFRNEPANSDMFITSGLWRYSRHPNYFGEIVLWTGIAVMALPVLSGWQLATLISPVFVYLLITRVSGIPMLEKSAKERWGSDPNYQHYVATTACLWPQPPKSSAR